MLNKKLKFHIALLTILAISLITYFGISLPVELNLSYILLFSLIIFASHNASMLPMVSAKTDITIKLPFILPGMMILSPFWITFLTAAFSFSFVRLKSHFVWYKFLHNRALLTISAGLASYSIYFLHEVYLIEFTALSFFVASVVYFLFNSSLMYITLALSGEGAPENVFSYISQLFKNVFISYVLALVFYQGYLIFGGIFLLLSLGIIYILKDLFYSRLQQMNVSTQVVESFLKVIDAKDNYTQGHCERVAEYTARLCRACGFSSKLTEAIVNMAKIHDIGKIHIEEEILKSSDSLTDEQYREMQRHSEYGFELLNDIELFEEDLDIIRHHHERYDGLGYPDGLEGEEIPKGARILSICDAFDVMTTGRDYKPALSKQQVIEEMKECAGQQFDPEYTREMIKLIEDNHFDDRFKVSETTAQDVESTRSRQIPLQQTVM